MLIWAKFSSTTIWKALAGRTNLQAILQNSGWLLADRVIRMGVGFFLFAWIARYLGPEQFGLWNYAIAFAGMFVVFSNLGLDSILIRELVKRPDQQHEILGTAFCLRLLASMATLCISVGVISLMRGKDALIVTLVGIYSAGFIFQSLNVIDLHFQSKLQSKFSVYAAEAAFVCATAIKIILLINGAPLIAFALAGLIEVALTSLFYVWAYHTTSHTIKLWSYKAIIAKSLLTDAWPMILYGLSIMICIRIDQLMIGEMLGDSEVGTFSAAVRISELLFVFPVLIVNSTFPAIIKAKKQSPALYSRRLQQLFHLVVIIGIGIAGTVSLLSSQIMDVIFGKLYADAAPVLSWHIWSGIFVSLGMVSGNWFIAENIQIHFFYRTVIGIFTNIVLNIWLIPIYGITGAAIATLLSQIFLAYFSDLLFRKTRGMFLMKTNALLLRHVIHHFAIR
jgi:PST family polysaccharide transporter